MRDIKLISQDGDYLILEDSEGQKYRLLLDETLRGLGRGQNQPKLDDPQLSPREIQEEIRVGRTIEEIVRASGAAEAYVRKFAQPVLDELNHAVLNALAVRLEISGDRFNEPKIREFGEIIKSRLAASGAGIESWSAMKAPDSGFYLYCDFELGGEQKRATWSYDPRRLALAPENELAISLSSQDKLAPPNPKLRPVQTQTFIEDDNLADTVDLTEYLNQEQNFTEPKELDEQVSETEGLLDSLRKMREQREESVIATSTLRIVEDPEVDSEEEPVQDETPPPAPALNNDEEKSPTPRKGRASIPSWDEIVFGTKTED